MIRRYLSCNVARSFLLPDEIFFGCDSGFLRLVPEIFSTSLLHANARD